jgi:hypothetical protein
MYFGGTKSVKYKDANKQIVESTYYDALVQIFEDVREQDEFLKKVQTDISQKFDRAQLNQSFAKLSDDNKKLVTESIQMIAKVINIIGNLVRYVILDIKTLRGSADKILKKANITKVKKESVESGFEYPNKEEFRAMYESSDIAFVEKFGESFDDLFHECVELFEEKSAKSDKQFHRSLTPEERKIADGRFGKIECSIMYDEKEKGYFATTHRARTKCYPTLEALPKGKVDFVSSTS